MPGEDVSVLPHMASKKSGLIINISSIVDPLPARTFNVKVMLVSPGGVKTNVDQNAATRFELQPNSLYTTYLDYIIKRMWVSQIPSSMSADDLVKIVAGKAFSAKPPFYLTMGSNTMMFGILKWLPRMWALDYMWKTYATPARK
ncbi:hypothetical protein C8R44DRAFT_873453 [Mycena epipterygia]|nr:hypothetical protein C8R44DRAFT_873453 [Mycena epipterygia]